MSAPEEPTDVVKPKRGIYLLPNLFTTAALFTGFYAIVAAMKGLFGLAAVAIFIAMLLDSLDGRVARLTNTQTEFGKEYDSLSDIVSFGLAPSLVLYSWSLYSLGKLGWLVSFLYTAAVALRLARFNVQAEHLDKRYFQGLPCPAAAGALAGLVWFCETYQIIGVGIAVLCALVTISLALLMVSNVRFYSFKTVDFRGRVPFVWLLLVVFLFVLIAMSPSKVLFLIFLGYALSGPVLTLWNLKRIKSRRHSKP